MSQRLKIAFGITALALAGIFSLATITSPVSNDCFADGINRPAMGQATGEFVCIRHNDLMGYDGFTLLPFDIINSEELERFLENS